MSMTGLDVVGTDAKAWWDENKNYVLIPSIIVGTLSIAVLMGVLFVKSMGRSYARA